jgi:hypothetical protein
MQKIAAVLSEARIDFQAFLQPGTKGLSSWQLEILKKAGSQKGATAVDRAGLDFLNRTYGSKAKAWAPVEWEVVGDWFGRPTEDSFLKSIFSMDSVPATPPTAGPPRAFVWVTDPLSRYLSKSELDRANLEHERVKKNLAKQGISVEDVEVAAFSSLDEQAEGLHLALAKRLTAGTPFFLVSSGYASAVLNRTLDLNPLLLRSSPIKGWVNVNGQLFGEECKSIRGLASISRADQPLSDTKRELALLREGRLSPQAPLGAGFPILNLVTLEGDHRPGGDIRDSLMPEGKTLFVPTGDGFGALGSVIPQLETNKN